jgi:nitrous oxide reductase accessory protein NosL
MPHHKGHIKKTLVVDAKTEKFIDVNDAMYVLGSKAPGTMSKVSKIAFKDKKDAKEFKKKMNGSGILPFVVALKTAQKQMKKDNAMLMKKKEMKVYPKGKKLYEQFCGDKIDFSAYHSITDIKVKLKKLKSCNKLDEKKLQMLALYIKDKHKAQKHQHLKMSKVNAVPKDQKCPVCGMYVYKYPRWVATLEVERNNARTKLYFDCVKDLVKFYQNPSAWGKYKKIKIVSVEVTDYYKQSPLDGKHAVYVANSDVLGPMGNELIPFDTLENAKVFRKDHGGSIIQKFENITPGIIKKLDE